MFLIWLTTREKVLNEWWLIKARVDHVFASTSFCCARDPILFWYRLCIKLLVCHCETWEVLNCRSRWNIRLLPGMMGFLGTYMFHSWIEIRAIESRRWMQSYYRIDWAMTHNTDWAIVSTMPMIMSQSWTRCLLQNNWLILSPYPRICIIRRRIPTKIRIHAHYWYIVRFLPAMAWCTCDLRSRFLLLRSPWHRLGVIQ